MSSPCRNTLGSSLYRRLAAAILLLSLPCTLQAGTHILLSPDAGQVEKHAASELAADIGRVYSDEDVLIGTYSAEAANSATNIIILGRTDSHPYLLNPGQQATTPLLKDPLEAEAFVLQGNGKTTVIAGADDRGVLYGAYEFSSRVLGVDPLEYWTGKAPAARTELSIPELAYREQPPVFKLRGYFDNDNDHLANWRGRKLIIEFETWKEMIDSLARLRYNYIDIHDLLGRPEYYLRDYYTQMTEYHTDLELVEQVIDYIHSKGLLVQIPMMLAWEFRHITLDQVCLSEYHDLWVETWEYYLAESPLGKADLFLVRPRHPIYDWAYKCETEKEQGIPPGPLIEAAFSELIRLLGEYRPDATLVTDLWQEGRALWQSGEFKPDKTLQVLWADNGYADFGGWPEDMKGSPFGIYLHAGVWHNQVVQDPYPDLIGKALGEAAARGMYHNALVNGQSFKPFILNLEAAAHALWNPETFNPDEFYLEWAGRYFGKDAAAETVAAMKLLHRAHKPVNGYRDVTKTSQKIIRNLSQGKPEPADADAVKESLELASQATELAGATKSHVPANSIEVYNDQVLYPMTLFVRNLEVLEALFSFNQAVISGQETRAPADLALTRLTNLHGLLREGSGWKKWEGWYNPENFRIHTPPPRIEDLEELIRSVSNGSPER